MLFCCAGTVSQSQTGNGDRSDNGGEDDVGIGGEGVDGDEVYGGEVHASSATRCTSFDMQHTRTHAHALTSSHLSRCSSFVTPSSRIRTSCARLRSRVLRNRNKTQTFERIRRTRREKCVRRPPTSLMYVFVFIFTVQIFAELQKKIKPRFQCVFTRHRLLDAAFESEVLSKVLFIVSLLLIVLCVLVYFLRLRCT